MIEKLRNGWRLISSLIKGGLELVIILGIGGAVAWGLMKILEIIIK